VRVLDGHAWATRCELCGKLALLFDGKRRFEVDGFPRLHVCEHAERGAR
jgi:hypothetical protein